MTYNIADIDQYVQENNVSDNDARVGSKKAQQIRNEIRSQDARQKNSSTLKNFGISAAIGLVVGGAAMAVRGLPLQLLLVLPQLFKISTAVFALATALATQNACFRTQLVLELT